MAKKRKTKRVKRFSKRRESSRNYNSPEYRKWKNKVTTRDGRKCRWPGCGSRKRLQVHHIKKWADYPLLRYDVNNGITICKCHHDFVRHKEEEYEAFFRKILINELLAKIQELNDAEEDKPEIHGDT